MSLFLTFTQFFQIVIEKDMFRSSHRRRCSVTKDALRNFAKLTGKHLCQILFFNKVAGLLRNVLTNILQGFKYGSKHYSLSKELCRIKKFSCTKFTINSVEYFIYQIFFYLTFQRFRLDLINSSFPNIDRFLQT